MPVNVLIGIDEEELNYKEEKDDMMKLALMMRAKCIRK